MTTFVRTFALAALATVLLAACSLSLPEPIELEGGVFGLDGVEVTLAAIAPTSIAPSATASFSGAIAETFVVDDADIPPVLRNLFKVASVDEAIGLGVSLVATSAEELPASFVVSAVSLTDLVIKKGVQTVFSDGFATITGATMTFSRVAPCTGICSYTASATTALADISLTGSEADKLAKAIIAGGTFTVTGNFVASVSPALPDDTQIQVSLVSLGAVLE
jgi:hypothetical protein